MMKRCARYAAMTLVNLSNEGTNQETIVMQGALPLLIKNATVQDSRFMQAWFLKFGG